MLISASSHITSRVVTEYIAMMNMRSLVFPYTGNLR